MVMGLCGLSLAWHRAAEIMGPMAGRVALLIGALATTVFVVLAVATVLRGLRHSEAWAEDRRHPVRHPCIAALPIALLLLATAAVSLFGPAAWAAWQWWASSLAQLFVTLWVQARWWRGNIPGGLQWTGVTLGRTKWSAAQCGIGLLFWPVALLLLSLSSLLILWLSLATLRGLRDASLLAPEPVAAILPLQA